MLAISTVSIWPLSSCARFQHEPAPIIQESANGLAQRRVKDAALQKFLLEQGARVAGRFGEGAAKI